jgi:hypothetical protein
MLYACVPKHAFAIWSAREIAEGRMPTYKKYIETVGTRKLLSKSQIKNTAFFYLQLDRLFENDFKIRLEPGWNVRYIL